MNVTIRGAVNEDISFEWMQNDDDPMNPSLPKTSSDQEIKQKIPINHIKSLSKIDLNSIARDIMLLEIKNGFFRCYDIIHDEMTPN